MKTSRFASVSAVAVLAFLSACSTPDSRIKKNQVEFNALPAETQQAIRAGHVDVGFTQSMVIMALGDPDRRYTRTTGNAQSEVWAYIDKGPALSFGVGMGSSRGGSAMGGGIGVSTAGDQNEDKIRVIFEGGKVTAIERRSR